MRLRAQRAGRSIRFALNPFLALGRSDGEAFDEAIKRIEAYTSDRVEVRMLSATKLGCIGPAEKVRRQIRRFGDIGIELLLLKIIPSVDNLRRIGSEIVRA